MIPNEYPSTTAPYKVAFVGDIPSKDDVDQRRPFVGAAGKLLTELMSRAKLLRAASYMGNICQSPPPGGVISAFEWSGNEIQSGIATLTRELADIKPNLVVPLGNTALHLFKAGNIPLRRTTSEGKPSFSYPTSIDSWRGSVFHASESSPLPGVKCLASFHPSTCLRAYENTPILLIDLNRAYKESHYPEARFPKRDIRIAYSLGEVLFFLRNIFARGLQISADIEGYWHSISCIGISVNEAFGRRTLVIPFFRKDGSAVWSFDEELVVWTELSAILSNPAIPKTWQNGLYDRWALQYGYSIPVRGNMDDTMLKWWEKYCELPKNLGMQVSILTDEPAYKGNRKSQDDTTFFRYCGTDADVTSEINTRLSNLLPSHAPTAVFHYRFNHALLNLLLYIELRGMSYDTALAKIRLTEVNDHIYILQRRLDVLSDIRLPQTQALRETLVREVMCFKKDPACPKKSFASVFKEALAIAQKETLSERDEGFLTTQLGTCLNIKGGNFKTLLKKLFGLEIALTPTGDAKADSLTLLKLWKKTDSPILELAMHISFLRTRSQMLHIKADEDNRIRSSYNVVGTKTGRISSSTSPTGSGYNLQTIPEDDKSKPDGHPLRKGMRDLIVADPGHWLFQCDLKGSDGWTIGAHLNKLGCSTMLDDLRNGIKPAMRIAYMRRHGNHSLRGKSLSEIQQLVLEVKKDDWDYFALKVGIWGICYLMGPDLLSDVVFEESDGKVNLSRKDVAEFRQAVMAGYQVHLWHNFMGTHLKASPTLLSASGNLRRFYGRSTEILGEALAQEPQANTTYATNLAAYRLWTDPENRASRIVTDSQGNSKRIPFVIEPLHQVHDALIGQFPIDSCEWAIKKIRTYFNNTLTIAGQQIVIPFEGNYGTSWGDLKKGKFEL